MKPIEEKLPDNSKAALERYIRELQRAYLSWYERASTRDYYVWLITQLAITVSGFATAILAVLINLEQFQNSAWLRILLVLIPVVGSFASTLLIQARLQDLHQLREEGRITIQYLISTAEQQFASATDAETFGKLHQWLVRQVNDLENVQAQRWYSLVPSQGIRPERNQPPANPPLQPTAEKRGG